MNAVIDIGNTKVKVGLFKQDEEMTVSTVDSMELIAFLGTNNVSSALVGNVGVDSAMLNQIKNTVVHLTELTVNTPMPITTAYETPATLGVDRLAACVGARKYANGNVLVIDAGTCITYDLLTNKDEHLGGLICPGLEMRLQAMHTLTSKLPLVSFNKEQLIGNSTQKCMQSGAANGTLAEMKGLIEGFNKDFENLSIIIGGGAAVFFDKNLELNTFVVSNLAIEGLHRIFKYNE